MKLLQAAVAAIVVFASSSAWGAITTVTQNFSVFRSSVGDDPIPSIDQYSGPLKLEAVGIAWSGFAGGYGLNNAPEGAVEEFYSAGYYSTLNVWAYNAAFEILALDSVQLLQFTECSQFFCGVSAAADRAFGADPAGFLGAGKIFFDSSSTNDVDFTGFDEWVLYGGATGTVTYYLSSGSAAVPEPAAWALMLAGFGAVGGAIRSRRRAAA